MEFLVHLLILGGGLAAFLFLIFNPKTVVVLGSVLLAGFIGSGAGIIGTIIGLAAGAVVGVILGLCVYALQEATGWTLDDAERADFLAAKAKRLLEKPSASTEEQRPSPAP